MRAFPTQKMKQKMGGAILKTIPLSSKLLIEEPPLQVLPSLALKIGLNEAIILQQVHYWLNPKVNKNVFEGCPWVYNTYEQWRQQFPFWGEKTIRRAIGHLEELKLLNSFVTRDFKKVKYYTINYERLEELQAVESSQPEEDEQEILENISSGQTDPIDLPEGAGRSGQADPIDSVNMTTFYITENTHENSSSPPLIPPHSERAPEEKEEEYKKMIQIWNEVIQVKFDSGITVYPTPQRLQGLQKIKEEIFHQDLEQWRSYCHQIAGNRFLMGQNTKGFKVTLDWALNPTNACKILEGAIYDNQSGNGQTKDHHSYQTNSNGLLGKSPLAIEREAKKQAILDSIEDSLWKGWCAQLDVGLQARDGVTLNELEGIANAWFIEVEDDKLVWIGSDNQNTLNQIENLRLKLSSIVEKTFPNTRAIRTRLEGRKGAEGGM